MKGNLLPRPLPTPAVPGTGRRISFLQAVCGNTEVILMVTAYRTPRMSSR
jgi:hypothetical protein